MVSQMSTNEEKLTGKQKKFSYTEPRKAEGVIDAMSMNEVSMQWADTPWPHNLSRKPQQKSPHQDYMPSIHN